MACVFDPKTGPSGKVLIITSATKLLITQLHNTTLMFEMWIITVPFRVTTVLNHRISLIIYHFNLQ